MGVSFNHHHRKCLTPDSCRERPPDQSQVVRKVELWFKFKLRGCFLAQPMAEQGNEATHSNAVYIAISS